MNDYVVSMKDLFRNVFYTSERYNNIMAVMSLIRQGNFLFLFATKHKITLKVKKAT